MKKVLVLIVTIVFANQFVIAQQIESKERAAIIAKEEFSKSKHKKVEKHGVIKELSKTIISTPAIRQNIKEYEGLYKANGTDYTLTLIIASDKNITGTIKESASYNNETSTLKNITIEDALFKAVKVNPDGAETPLEGVFIDKSDNGLFEFGLGIKLPKSITINNTVNIDKLFFKKVD